MMKIYIYNQFIKSAIYSQICTNLHPNSAHIFGAIPIFVFYLVCNICFYVTKHLMINVNAKFIHFFKVGRENSEAK